ncbi:MAG TPA: hypothetical protein GX721_02500 [Firmicutes bacterium]|jgi:hypothetical protein|nr:hypothetical protein [Bacillota bacterium]
MSATMPALFAENAHPLEKLQNRRSGSQTMKVIVRVMRARNNTGINATVLFALDKGEPIREIRYDFSKVSLEEAGLRASLESLKIAGRYRAKHIVIYIDNERVASIANGTEIPPPDLIGLALQLRAFCHSFKSIVFRYGTSGTTPSLLRLHKSGKKGQLSHVL